MTLDREFLCAVVDFGSGPTFVCGRVDRAEGDGSIRWLRVTTPDGPTLPEPIPVYEDFAGTLLTRRPDDASRAALVAFYRANPDTLRERRNLITRSE
jgi:hypothetical protein